MGSINPLPGRLPLITTRTIPFVPTTGIPGATSRHRHHQQPSPLPRTGRGEGVRVSSVGPHPGISSALGRASSPPTAVLAIGFRTRRQEGAGSLTRSGITPMDRPRQRDRAAPLASCSPQHPPVPSTRYQSSRSDRPTGEGAVRSRPRSTKSPPRLERYAQYPPSSSAI
jgi:hypothetical protein